MVLYNQRHDVMEDFVMPKTKVQLKKGEETFGERLVRLRHAAGYSQREFATEVGISQRMVVYYEKEAGRLPTPILPVMAKALGISADQLLGIVTVKANGRIRDTKLWRRFAEVEQLPPARRRPIVQVIDSFLRGEKAVNRG